MEDHDKAVVIGLGFNDKDAAREILAKMESEELTHGIIFVEAKTRNPVRDLIEMRTPYIDQLIDMISTPVEMEKAREKNRMSFLDGIYGKRKHPKRY